MWKAKELRNGYLQLPVHHIKDRKLITQLCATETQFRSLAQNSRETKQQKEMGAWSKQHDA